MQITSASMDKAYLRKLQAKPWYSKVEKYLFRGDKPSVVRMNLEDVGFSEEEAHQLVKNLWGLQNSKDLDADFAARLYSTGTSQDQSTSDFCPYELAVGTLVELEHIEDFDVALEIAKDHLAEDPVYYSNSDFPEEAIERIQDTVAQGPEEEPVDSSLKKYLLPIQSINVKTTEDYYKKGLLSEKEVIAILTRENGWPQGDAEIVARLWKQMYSSMKLVPVYYNTVDDHFQPVGSSLASSSLADDLNDLYPHSSPEDFVKVYAQLKQHKLIKSSTSSHDVLDRALLYYKKTNTVPSFEDFVGYLHFVGDFKDYKTALADHEKLVKEFEVK